MKIPVLEDLAARWGEKMVAIPLLLLAFMALHAVFGGFLHAGNERWGHDYAYFMPSLLEGYYWFVTNGPFEVPWFTPAFCGGLPYLANPQVMYHSVPQVAAIVLGPTAGIYATFLCFGLLGGVGSYLLLRGPFRMSIEVSGFGAVAFMFNGFFVYRMLIGHLTYHSFMLLPLLAFVLLREGGGGHGVPAWRRHLPAVVWVGLLFAYMAHSGALNFILPALIAVVGLKLIHSLVWEERPPFWGRLAAGGAVAMALSATKLVSGMLFLASFERGMYGYPGASGPGRALMLVVQSLFLGGSSSMGAEMITPGFRWTLQRHEFEYGVSPVVGLLLLVGAVVGLRRLAGSKGWRSWSKGTWIALGALVLVILAPVALNVHSAGWHALLKKLPYLRNSSSFLRWIAIEIPLLVVLAALALERCFERPKVRLIVAVMGGAGILLFNVVVDRHYYRAQPYNPELTFKGFDEAKRRGKAPLIRRLAQQMNRKGQPVLALSRNDLLVTGGSPILCYEPLFGYRSEKLPVAPMVPGPITGVRKGKLNIKNPACYVFGRANGCRPGAHFREGQRKAALAFAGRRPFAFELPVVQRLANWLNILSLLGLGLVGLWGGWVMVGRWRRGGRG